MTAGLPPHNSGVLLIIDGGGSLTAGGAVLAVEGPLCVTGLTLSWLSPAASFDNGGHCLTVGCGLSVVGGVPRNAVEAFTQTFVRGSVGSPGSGGGGDLLTTCLLCAGLCSAIFTTSLSNSARSSRNACKSLASSARSFEKLTFISLKSFENLVRISLISFVNSLS